MKPNQNCRIGLDWIGFGYRNHPVRSTSVGNPNGECTFCQNRQSYELAEQSEPGSVLEYT